MTVIYLSLWRLGMLMVLLASLQVNPGRAFRSRKGRGKPKPAQTQASTTGCKQTGWTPWSECEPFCDANPKQTRTYIVKGKWKCQRIRITTRSCAGNGGCSQKCNARNRTCACFKGFSLERSNGKNCIDDDECKPNNGKGPCSHSCKNTRGDYSCECESGYHLEGRTQCVLQDCLAPQLPDCPKPRKQSKRRMSDGGLPLCKKVAFACLNGTKYKSQCSVSCPSDYTLALKDPHKEWSDYSSFDFKTPSNRIICQVKSDNTVFWHSQLTRYYCRRKNDPPSAIELDNVRIKEKLPLGSTVGQLKARDAQRGQRILFSVHSSGGKSYFYCSGSTLKSTLVLKWKPRGSNSYPVRIRAQDNGSPNMWTEQVFNISVTNVNDPPRSIEISENSVYENVSIGSVVGKLSAVDDDLEQGRSSNFSWRLLGNSSVNFRISGDEVVVRKRLDYHQKKVHYIKVSCGDSLSFSETVLIIHVINFVDPPTLRLTGSLKVPENSPPGTFVGRVQAKSESNQDMMFALTEPNAQARPKFALSPRAVCIHDQNATRFHTTCYVNLTLNAHVDYEEESRYVVQVLVRNNQSSNFMKWNISIENVNEKPEKLELNGLREIPEATKSGTDFCLITVSDPDNRNKMIQHHSCRVDNQGGDGQYFQVNTSTNALQVKENKTLNYERKQRYHVTLTCTDDGSPPLSITRDVIINVTDTDEPIQSMNLSNNKIPENAAVGTIVGILDAYDPDVHRPKTMTFSLVCPKDSPFILRGNSNKELVLNRTINFEETSAVVLTIRVNDTSGSHLQWPFRIEILDVNESPTDIKLSAQTMDEDLAPGSSISNITMVDEDENTMTNCEIFKGEDGRVSVYETMLVAGNRPADYEMDSSHSLEITLRCCDQFSLCVAKNFSIKIKDVNEAPTDITVSNLQVEENQQDIVIGKITVIDVDRDQTHRCALSSNDDDEREYLMIKETQGTLHLIKPLDFEHKQSRSFNITCKEVGDNLTYSITKEFALNVVDINEVPRPGCSSPLYVTADQSVGTVLGSLNVTDPDNEVAEGTDEDLCQQKQKLKYILDSHHEDLPFGVFDGLLVKTGHVQVNKTYRVLITAEDDGVVWSLSSSLTVRNRTSVRFNCSILSVTSFRPHITLSSNKVDVRATNGTIIGYLNTSRPANVKSGYYGDREYQIVKKKCTSNAFATVKNALTVLFPGGIPEIVSDEDDENAVPDYVIVHVRSASGNGSTDVIKARFLIVVKADKAKSRMCLHGKQHPESRASDAKLGSIIIYQDYKNTTNEDCPEKERNSENQKGYVCKVRPKVNESSADFRKVNLTDAIYVDRDLTLRSSISLNDVNLNLNRLVVQVKCQNSRMPLVFVKGKFTFSLAACARKNVVDGRKVCAPCEQRPCAADETCVDIPHGGYECKASWDTCDKRYDSFCDQRSCGDESLCSRNVNRSQRCVPKGAVLYFGLKFILHENTTCEFENCLGESFEKNESSCLGKWSDQRRKKRHIKSKFNVEVLQISLSPTHQVSLVSVAVWKFQDGRLKLQTGTSVRPIFSNTKDVVLIKTVKDCSIFQESEIECPVAGERSHAKQEWDPFLTPKIQAALGAGAAVIFIVISLVVVYCLLKRRIRKKEMLKRQAAEGASNGNNLGFDAVEMNDFANVREMPKTKDRENGNKKEVKHDKKKKSRKAKYDFNNRVYEEPKDVQCAKERLAETEVESAILTSEIYSGAHSQDPVVLRGRQTMSNPFYAASDKICVQNPGEDSKQNTNSQPVELGHTNDCEMLNPRDKARLSDPANRYPFYEELPPLQDGKKKKKLFSRQAKSKTADTKHSDATSRSLTDCQNNRNNRGNWETNDDVQVYYYVLDKEEQGEYQGVKSGDGSEQNKLSLPQYFVLEKTNSKEYQSLHREFEQPFPAYERYRSPEKSDEQKTDKAGAKERVYEDVESVTVRSNTNAF